METKYYLSCVVLDTTRGMLQHGGVGCGVGFVLLGDFS